MNLVIHPTQKLQTKLRIRVLATNPTPSSDHLRRYATLFRANRRQYILTTNASSLYSVVMHGAGVTDYAKYLERFLVELRDQLQHDGMSGIYDRCIGPWATSAELAKTESRSVLGSMNDMVRLCEFRVDHSGWNPLTLARHLNEMPFGALKFRVPMKVFANLPESAAQTT